MIDSIYFIQKEIRMVVKKQQFASDNYSGICQEALELMLRANSNHEKPYGNDSWTMKASNMFRDFFEADCEVFFAFNGTAANSLALASLCQSYNSIICSEVAHVETDECGAPQFFSNGSKLLLAKTNRLGKIEPSEIEKIVKKRQDIHYPKPNVVTITQATEQGTVYTVDEISGISKKAKELGLYLHMDGARFANACAFLQKSPAELTWKSGVDVLCFGGTKNGMAVGEAIVFFNKELANGFDFRCKQAGQLASKMRYLAAPWVGMLKNNIWLKHATHANKCARILEGKLKKISGVKTMFPVESNSVFVEMDVSLNKKLQKKGWDFYTFIGEGGVRFMCSWDTTIEHIDELIKDIKYLSN